MENQREKLIISADDFGLSTDANRNILELAKLGKLDRVSVMILGQFTAEEITALKNSGIVLDIHLEITELSDGKKSIFLRLVKFFWLYSSGRTSPAKLEAEWKAQIEGFKKLFQKYPDGLNSHEHVHFFPPYFKIAMRLCQESSIGYVRFGKNKSLRHVGLISSIIHFLCKKNYAAFQSALIVSSQDFVSFDWIRNFEGFLEKLPSDKTELVFHPEREKEKEAILKYF